MKLVVLIILPFNPSHVHFINILQESGRKWHFLIIFSFLGEGGSIVPCSMHRISHDSHISFSVQYINALPFTVHGHLLLFLVPMEFDFWILSILFCASSVGKYFYWNFEEHNKCILGCRPYWMPTALYHSLALTPHLEIFLQLVIIFEPIESISVTIFQLSLFFVSSFMNCKLNMWKRTIYFPVCQ